MGLLLLLLLLSQEGCIILMEFMSVNVVERAEQIESNLWHQQYAHNSSTSSLPKLTKKHLVCGLNAFEFGDLSFCKSCVNGKL